MLTLGNIRNILPISSLAIFWGYCEKYQHIYLHINFFDNKNICLHKAYLFIVNYSFK